MVIILLCRRSKVGCVTENVEIQYYAVENITSQYEYKCIDV
jgi:hypothetical protein